MVICGNHVLIGSGTGFFGVRTAAARMATGFAVLRVEAHVGGVLTLQAELTADLIQSFDLRFGEFLRAAELSGKEKKRA